MPQPDTEYREITVRLWGKGVIERGRITGASLTGRRFVAHAGQFIVSRIDARNGATGIVPSSLEGALVTNDFPLFSINKERLDIAFLGWICRTATFVELCQRASEGTTNRIRLKEGRFLTLKIPLPPLAEQRRLVARIEALAAQVEEAKSLRRKSGEHASALSHSFLSKLLRNEEKLARWSFRPLAEIAGINPRCKKKLLEDNCNVSFVPMRTVSDETGEIILPEKRSYSEVKSGYTRFEDGDVIFARITPCMQNGKSAIAKGLINGIGFGSTEFHVVRPGPKVEAKWLHHIFRHCEFLKDAAAHFTGTAGQQRVPVSYMRNKTILVPPLSDQRRIVAELDTLQAEVDRLKAFQAETAVELDALLPAILDRAFKGEL